jgi:hypothetical protein
MRGMRRRGFRGYRRPFFRPLWPWRRFGLGWWGMGCLLHPLLAVFVLVVLSRLAF